MGTLYGTSMPLRDYKECLHHIEALYGAPTPHRGCMQNAYTERLHPIPVWSACVT